MFFKTMLLEAKGKFTALICPRKADLRHYLILSTLGPSSGSNPEDDRALIELLENYRDEPADQNDSDES